MNVTTIKTIASAASDIRLRDEFMRYQGEALRGFPDRIQRVRELTATEGKAILEAGWDSGAALESEDLLHQHQVLEDAIQRAEEFDALVFVVLDGVNYRQAQMASKLWLGSPSGLSIRPVVVHPPAMTTWGHFTLLHGVNLTPGLNSALNQPPKSRSDAPLLAWANQRGLFDGNPPGGWQNTARQKLEISTRDKLAEFLQPGMRWGYTGVESVYLIQNNAILPFLRAMEATGASGDTIGARREMGQFGRLRQLLKDSEGSKGAMILSRFSVDSRGESDKTGSGDHHALSASGHFAGPFHEHVLQYIGWAWANIVRVVKDYSPFKRTLIVASSDHGMNPVVTKAINPESKRAMPDDGILKETENSGTAWFNGRGIFGLRDALEQVRCATSALNGGKDALSPEIVHIDNELCFTSLAHGWGMNAVGSRDYFRAGAHLGDHGGDGFDDLIVPYIEQIIKSSR